MPEEILLEQLAKHEWSERLGILCTDLVTFLLKLIPENNFKPRENKQIGKNGLSSYTPVMNVKCFYNKEKLKRACSKQTYAVFYLYVFPRWPPAGECDSLLKREVFLIVLPFLHSEFPRTN